MEQLLRFFPVFAALFLWVSAPAQTYTNGTPVPIPEAVAETGTCGANTSPGVAVSSIPVPLSGWVLQPDRVTVGVNLTHTWAGDITVELVTPAGHSCALIKRLGSHTDTDCGSSIDFMAGAVMRFNAANMDTITTLGGAHVPAGNYAPTSGGSDYPSAIPLCDLSTFLDHVGLSGNWLLRVYDSGYPYTGQLNGWSLTFDTGALGMEGYAGAPAAVYPNPASGILYIDAGAFVSGSGWSASLHDITGRQVRVAACPPSGGNAVSVDVSDLAPGMYSLRLEAGNRQQVKKVWISR